MPLRAEIEMAIKAQMWNSSGVSRSANRVKPNLNYYRCAMCYGWERRTGGRLPSNKPKLNLMCCLSTHFSVLHLISARNPEYAYTQPISVRHFSLTFQQQLIFYFCWLTVTAQFTWREFIMMIFFYNLIYFKTLLLPT